VCKKLRFAAGILIVIITAGMCGCLKNRQVEAGIGSMSVHASISAVPSAASPPEVIIVRLTLGGFEVIEELPITDNSASGLIPSLAAGIWNVDVAAVDGEGDVIYEGKDKVEVTRDSVVPLAITLNPVPGRIRFEASADGLPEADSISAAEFWVYHAGGTSAYRSYREVPGFGGRFVVEDALKNDRFILHFQPIIPIVAFNRCSDDSTQLTSSEHDNALKWVGGKGGKARLYEALIRIEGDDGNVVPPGEFIPWAEAIGLIPQVDLWVLKNVIATLHERPDMNIAMNLSARSISRSSFLAQVEKCVSRSGLAPGRLGFEITETAGLGNLKAVRNWMKHMKALGCCFAIDDFGSGYASMAYLSNLPVDIVKIAGSIVRSMSSSPSGRLIVEAISSVVHVTGAWAVAESVEDQETLFTLREMGVDFAQGFYIARPSALDTIARHAPK
jgi:EAL domain-containing protein (putative c-di-GMP-specific phosphodiesterase class I)